MYSLAISIREAAKAISVGRTKLYAHINAGEISTVKLAGRNLVLVSSLESFVKRNTHNMSSDQEGTSNG